MCRIYCLLAPERESPIFYAWFVIVFIHSTERNGLYVTWKLSNSAGNAVTYGLFDG